MLILFGLGLLQKTVGPMGLDMDMAHDPISNFGAVSLQLHHFLLLIMFFFFFVVCVCLGEGGGGRERFQQDSKCLNLSTVFPLWSRMSNQVYCWRNWLTL